jgi:hypothetical protein
MGAPSPTQLDRRPVPRDRSRHALLALLYAAPFLLAPWLSITGDRVTLFGGTGPECLVRAWLPASCCPGCGASRSIVAALAGDWASAFRFHAAGPPLLALAGAAALAHGWIALRASEPPRLLALRRAGARALALALLAAFALRLARVLPAA